jgi:DNA-binding response OmpR family regulator
MTPNSYVALLLEDEPLIAMDVEGELERATFAVTTLLSCADAVRWLQGHRPDVVIIDIMLRDGTSAGVVDLLIAAQIPFIVHSGSHPSAYKNTPFRRGVWINKPCNTSDIVQAAQTLLAA